MTQIKDLPAHPSTVDGSEKIAAQTTAGKTIRVTTQQMIDALSSSGDMEASVYDPTTVSGDAFDMDNMVESATKKVLTSTERTKLAGIETGATADQTGAEIKSAYEAEADTNAFTDAEKTKLAGVESGATADQSNAEIETAYNAQVDVVAQAEAEAGTATTVRRWTAERVKQAIDALGSGGVGVATHRRVYLNSGSPHTWTKPSDASFIGVRVWVIGGGGGGGGVNRTSGTPRGGHGGGGGGSYAWIVAASLGATETVTVGAGGAGGAAGANNGVAGGTSSFGAHVSCTGGALGTGVSDAQGTSGAGGTATGGDVNNAGMPGVTVAETLTGRGGGSAAVGAAANEAYTNAMELYWIPSNGPIAAWAGRGAARVTSSTSADGIAGRLFGGGGSGGVRQSNGTQAGGAGANGIIVVEEVYQ